MLRARAGRAWAAQGGADVWLRAEEAALAQARGLLASQLWLAVPCLKRLAADGALDVEVSPFTSRKKHVYRLTDQGNRLFHQLLETADGHELEQDRFSMRLAFFRYLRPEARLYQLERRRGYLQERLADLRASVRTARERMDAYTIELMDHGLDEREREIAWLDRLIARERRSTEAPPSRTRLGPSPRPSFPSPRATPACPHRPGRPRRPGGDQTPMGKLRVAIVGVGNCASSLVQGVHFYRDAEPGEHVPGLMHVELGGYHVRDIEFVAAFDVDAKKVGRDLAEAIRSGAEQHHPFAEVPALGRRGAARPDAGRAWPLLRARSSRSPTPPRSTWSSPWPPAGADVLVCYLPVGSEEAARYYAEQALKAGCAFVNCLPVFIAAGPSGPQRFAEGRRADHRRRHQVAGRRHHRPPRAEPSDGGPRRPASTAPTS